MPCPTIGLLLESHCNWIRTRPSLVIFLITTVSIFESVPSFCSFKLKISSNHVGQCARFFPTLFDSQFFYVYFVAGCLIWGHGSCTLNDIQRWMLDFCSVFIWPLCIFVFIWSCVLLGSCLGWLSHGNVTSFEVGRVRHLTCLMSKLTGHWHLTSKRELQFGISL